MKTLAIIQARMGSSRLPGKVLLKINDIEMLKVMTQRVLRSKLIDQLVIATTCNSIDDPLVEFCKDNNLSVFRGSEDDVLNRYYECAKTHNPEIVVRLTSDCPLIESTIIDQTILTHITNNADYTSNRIIQTFPRGLDVEVFNFKSLEIAEFKTLNPVDREHVTPFFYCNQDVFKCINLANSTDMSEHRWTVDTVEDYKLIEAIFTEFQGDEVTVNMIEVFNFLESNPDVKNINSKIKQKELNRP